VGSPRQASEEIERALSAWQRFGAEPDCSRRVGTGSHDV
jgi:hypothetical protein